MLKKIIIKGMSCSHCVNHVREALSELKDSQKVEVNLEQKYAIVETSYTEWKQDLKWLLRKDR